MFGVNCFFEAERQIFMPLSELFPGFSTQRISPVGDSPRLHPLPGPATAPAAQHGLARVVADLLSIASAGWCRGRFDRPRSVVAEQDIGKDHEFAHDGNKCHPVVFPPSLQPVVQGFQLRIVRRRRQGRHVQDIARPAAAAADMPGPGRLAALLRVGRHTDERTFGANAML